MTQKTRKIEIFSADCSLCNDVIKEVRAAACPSCDIQIRDMSEYKVQERAVKLGIKSVPAVVINGKLADCCSARGVDLDVLKTAGLGQQIMEQE